MTTAAGRWPKRGAAWVFRMVLLVFVGSNARAESPRVVLAQPAAPDEVVAEVATRVRAELKAAAFDVVIVYLTPGSNPRDQVEAASIEPRPLATLAIVRLADRPAIDVWVYDRLTEKTLVKRLDLGKRPDAEMTSALAIHAVELLRASLLQTRARSQAPAATPKPVPREVGDWVDRAVQPQKALYEGPTVGVAGAVLHSFGGIGPAFAPAIRVGWGTPNGFAGRLSIVGPAFGANLESAKGTAFVRQELALIEVVYAPSHSWLSPLASLGAGGYHLYTSGQPSDPRNVPSTDDVWSALIDAGLGLGARLGASAALSLELHAFFTEPAAHVGIGDGSDDTSFGPTGRPSIVGSLGLQANF